MHLHNPHSFTVLCPALQETLEPFAARELTGEDAKLASNCPDCRCTVIGEPPGPEKSAPRKPAAEPSSEAPEGG